MSLEIITEEQFDVRYSLVHNFPHKVLMDALKQWFKTKEHTIRLKVRLN